MMNPVEVIIFVLMFILLGWLAFGFFCFDSLLRHQMTHYREDWDNHGQPVGFFSFRNAHPIAAVISLEIGVCGTGIHKLRIGQKRTRKLFICLGVCAVCS
jgi:hypothetical protein